MLTGVAVGRRAVTVGFVVAVAHDGDTGLEMALRGDYDALIVDWMLPGRDGPTICGAVRAAHLDTPILMLTARGEVEDRVLGLDKCGLGRRGAADCVGHGQRHCAQTLAACI